MVTMAVEDTTGRQCIYCGNFKSLRQFRLYKKGEEKRRTYCIECCNKKRKDRMMIVKQDVRTRDLKGNKQCNLCSLWWTETDFGTDNQCGDFLKTVCIHCSKLKTMMTENKLRDYFDKKLSHEEITNAETKRRGKRGNKKLELHEVIRANKTLDMIQKLSEEGVTVEELSFEEILDKNMAKVRPDTKSVSNNRGKARFEEPLVYAIIVDNRVKVGETTNIGRRIGEISRMSGMDYRLDGVRYCDNKDRAKRYELSFHEKFIADRIYIYNPVKMVMERTEFFHLTDEIRDFLFNNFEEYFVDHYS